MISDICPACTPSGEIHWADLIAGPVQLCPEHQSATEGNTPLSGEFEP
jgi:hypothetical protein